VGTRISCAKMAEPIKSISMMVELRTRIIRKFFLNRVSLLLVYGADSD